MFSIKKNFSQKKIILASLSLLFILISICYINFSTKTTIIEPAFFLLFSILLAVQIIVNKKPIVLENSELLFALFIIYTILQSVQLNLLSTSSLYYLPFFLFLHCGFKIFFSANTIVENSFLLLISMGVILLAYVCLVIFHYYYLKEPLSSFFIPNISVFAILLASQLAFLLPSYLNFKSRITSSKIVTLLIQIIIFSSVLLLVFTNGRAGCIGLILSVFYIIHCNISNSKKRNGILYFLVFLIIVVSSLLFLYKQDSSKGRVLIYKVSATMVKDNWLWGIGYGQFKVVYNKYQAVYFASHNIDSKEAQLADNSYYAFNDFFEAFIENGVIGFSILISLLFSFFITIKKVKIKSADKHLFTSSVACLICLITGSLFSYPLQIFPIIIQAILCFSIINSFSPASKRQITLSKAGFSTLKYILLTLHILLVIYFSFYLNYKVKNTIAFELKKTGFKREAMELYKELSTSYSSDGNMFYSYSQELYNSNQLQKAKEFLDKAKKYYTSNEVYKLSAAIENDLQNYAQAEKNYKTAIYMVPNRIISRKELLDFYLERKDSIQAVYWANSIIDMPVKIPSEVTLNIQENTKKILAQLIKR